MRQHLFVMLISLTVLIIWNAITRMKKENLVIASLFYGKGLSTAAAFARCLGMVQLILTRQLSPRWFP